ncbi:MAG: glycoside hydrolase [Planctomycetota bacterium]|nr:MAG: glycoside hydrolase [Planctomycetota bacterium]
MGVMRFEVQPPELLEHWPELNRAYISGFDGRVHPTKVERDGNIVGFRRQSSESGRLHVAFPVEGFGRPMLTTSSLREFDGVYNLAVELARGKICQIRNQLAAWENAGMKIPERFRQLHSQAHALFARAASSQHEPLVAARFASQALGFACQAADELMRAYVEQRLIVRRHRSHHLPAAIGCQLGVATDPQQWAHVAQPPFSAAWVPLSWKYVEAIEGEYDWEPFDEQIEWCLNHRLIVQAGPLLDFSPGGLPQWLQQWASDFYNLQSFLCDFVETAIARYIGKVRQWEVCARPNTGGGLQLSEENLVALVARTVEVARQVDEESRFVVRVNQPFGEYQARGTHRLAPLQFVDALVRLGVGLSGINLELNMGYGRCGTAMRDLLDVSRLIDLWSCLDVPLQVTICVPSSSTHDPMAHSGIPLEANGWHKPWSEQAQAEWLDHYLPLFLAKQTVVAIFWHTLSDAVPHEFPHSGLLRADKTPKPALEQFARTVQEHWPAETLPAQ